MRRAGVLLSIAALLFPACGTDEPEAARPQPVEVRAANYTFALPTTIEAGVAEITLKNAGPEPHQAQVLRLNEGVTAKKIIDAAKTESADVAIAKLATWAGGPNAVDAGESQVTTTNIPAGDFVFMCLVPDAKGRPHASLGMVKAFSVAKKPAAIEVPEPDARAATKDFDFELPATWQGSIEVENHGGQPHEFQVMEIAEGKTEKDFTDWFKAAPGTAGPPTWATGGGVAAIAPGGFDRFEADLEPGVYYLMCFVTDPAKKAPHFALGMMKRFEVK
jgi:hypothetical protein